MTDEKKTQSEYHDIHIGEDFIKQIKSMTEIFAEQVEKGELPPYSELIEQNYNQMSTPQETFHKIITCLNLEAANLLNMSTHVWVVNAAMDPDSLIEKMGDIRFLYQKLLNMVSLKDEDIAAFNRTKIMTINGAAGDPEAFLEAMIAGKGRQFFGQQEAKSEVEPKIEGDDETKH